MIKYVALIALLASCSPDSSSELNNSTINSKGNISFRADVWADNWFAFYVGDQLIIEDSVPITTERSFNSEIFSFNADYPLQLNFVLKDFKQNDSGLEYIGARNQQMGDGGFIAQVFDNSSDGLVGFSQASGWKCLVIHEAPTDKACESLANPTAGVEPCGFNRLEEPAGWKELEFDDSSWPDAVEHSARAIGPKGGYDSVDWRDDAKLIWSGDLETDNTLLCRATVNQ